jgi:hypothetical protein
VISEASATYLINGRDDGQGGRQDDRRCDNGQDAVAALGSWARFRS